MQDAETTPESEVPLTEAEIAVPEVQGGDFPEFGASEILSLDIFNHPVEPFLAILAVVGAFIFVIGLMMNISTELTEEGPWFFLAIGVTVPLITYGLAGWPMLAVWMFLTSLVFIFIKARTLYWLTLFPALIFIPIVCLVIRHFIQPFLGQSGLAHEIAGWALEILPGILVPACVLLILKVDLKKHWPWFVTIIAPALVDFVIQAAAGSGIFVRFVIALTFISIALIIAITTPIVLGVKRRGECGRPILIGSSLLGAGAAIIALTFFVHAGYFAN
ncbi:MAG: hypothetical protein ACI8UO_005249 [Verrucomicrobiales bacterium]